jgi:hypothetical protein
MKTTAAALQFAAPALGELMSIKLPAKFAYAVSKLAHAVDAELKQIAEAREKIFKDAGCTVVTETVDEKEINRWDHEDKEVLEKAAKEAFELNDVEVELNVLPLDLDQLGDRDVEPRIFYPLDFAIKS